MSEEEQKRLIESWRIRNEERKAAQREQEERERLVTQQVRALREERVAESCKIEAGIEALNYEAELKTKMAIFDNFQGKVAALFDLDPGSDKYFPLLQVSEEYLGTIFEKNQIKETYANFIEAYRKFITLRDIVALIRTVQSNENEPICTICIQETVVFCMNPCGHTYCHSCSQRQAGPCFVCRTPVKDKIRIFFN